jgi:hypothetical protein
MIRQYKLLIANALTAVMVSMAAGVLPAVAQKPTIMAIPSDRYLNEQGYVETVSTTGGDAVVPNYRQALLSDRYVATAIAAVNSAFQEANYPIQSLEAALRNADMRRTELLVSDRSVQQSMRDLLLSQARSDILLEIDFFEERVMGNTSVSMTIQAIDSYNSQAIATVTQTGQHSAGTPFSVLVREGIVQNMPAFEARLMSYFSSLAERGRAGVIEFVLEAGAPFDFEEWISLSDGSEEELGTILKDMIRRNSVNSAYHVAMETRTQHVYNEVRVPLFDDEGYPIDVPTWANSVLVRQLRSQFNLDVRRESLGLSHARLIVMGFR